MAQSDASDTHTHTPSLWNCWYNIQVLKICVYGFDRHRLQKAQSKGDACSSQWYVGRAQRMPRGNDSEWPCVHNWLVRAVKIYLHSQTWKINEHRSVPNCTCSLCVGACVVAGLVALLPYMPPLHVRFNPVNGHRIRPMRLSCTPDSFSPNAFLSVRCHRFCCFHRTAVPSAHRQHCRCPYILR